MGASATGARRGAILVSVLWILIFLGFLAVILRVQMTGVVASVRVTEDKASARIVAEAGLAWAAAEIRAGPADGGSKLSDQISSTITLPAGTASVTASNEALRIDLNTAERPLIVAALRAAGAAPGDADDLATKVIARRPAPTPQGGASALPPSQQGGSGSGLFQTVAELAWLSGMTPEIAIGAEPYVTVSSGLAGARLELLDDGLLGDIPGLPPAVVQAIHSYRAGRLAREQLDPYLASVSYNTVEQAPTWRVTLHASLPSGYSEDFTALVLVSATDDAPYRVLDWRRAAIELE